MALFKLHLTHHTRTNGAPHPSQQAAYILRQEEGYAAQAEAYGWTQRHLAPTYREDLLYSGQGNLPPWAEGKPVEFFAAAERYERANGRIASSLILGLPRELSHTHQVHVVQEWCALQYPTHPYVVAMHSTTLADGGAYPHAHILYSIRMTDEMNRGAVQHFARWNATAPGRGGARKDRAFDGYGLLRALRHTWSDLVNWHVERAGLEGFIDPRSLHHREIPRRPEPRLASYHGLLAKHRGIITPQWQDKLDTRAANVWTKPLEAQKATEWWQYRKALLGLTGAESSSHLLVTLRANQRLETTQFQHPGGPHPREPRSAIEKQEVAVRAAVRTHGKQRAMGKPLTGQMIAEVHRLGLQTTQVLRALAQEREPASHGQGFGD